MDRLGRGWIHRPHQILINLFGQERQSRRHDACDRGEHRIERLIGFVVARPETAAGAAQIPVRELLVEFLERFDQTEVLEVLESAVSGVNQTLQAAQTQRSSSFAGLGGALAGFQPSAVAYITKKL